MRSSLAAGMMSQAHTFDGTAEKIIQGTLVFPLICNTQKYIPHFKN